MGISEQPASEERTFETLDRGMLTENDDVINRILYNPDPIEQQSEPQHSDDDSARTRLYLDTIMQQLDRIECLPGGDHANSNVPRWKTKSPDQWSIADADEWLFHARIHVGQSFYKMKRRYNITGRELRELPREHFVTTEYKNGGRIYDMLHSDNIFLVLPHEDSDPVPPISEDERSGNYVPHAESDSSSEVIEKRSPGRPRVPKPSKKQCQIKLWEYIRNLLHDPDTNPSLICWENYEEGSFRFIQGKEVAKRWGGRKGNDEMNYEKFTRAMRYYYKTKIFKQVDSRRVYKFGENAKGWRTENPILCNESVISSSLEVSSLK